MPSADSRLLLPGRNFIGTIAPAEYVHVDPRNANAVDVEVWNDGSGTMTTLTVLDSALPGTGYNPVTDTAYVSTMTGVTGYQKVRVGSVMEHIRVSAVIASGTWYCRVTPIQAVSGPTTITNVASSNLTQVNGVGISLGQTIMANSLPVAIASNQSNLPMNLAQVGGNNVVTGGLAGSQGVGGLAAAGATAAGNPLVGGTQDPSTNAQYLQSDAAKNLFTTMGTGLDQLDDAVVAAIGADYPAQVTTTLGGSVTTATQTLVSGALGGASPSMQDITAVVVEVENAVGTTISNAMLQYNDTVGSTVVNNQVNPTVTPSIGTGTVGQVVFIVPPSAGPLKNIQVVWTFGASSTGTLKTQAWLSSVGHSFIGGQPKTVQSAPQSATNAAQIADNTGVDRPLATVPYLWNGTTAANATPASNNQDVTLLASAARTVTTNSADVLNPSGSAVYVILNTTVIGTGSVTLHIQGKDSVSAAYYDILVATAAVVTNATFVYAVGLGIGAAADGLTQVKSAMLPRTWRVSVIANNANSATYSVGAQVVNA